MAVAFDAGASNGADTFLHTCSGSDRYLLVSAVYVGSQAVIPTGITYNSVPLTLLRRSAVSGVVTAEIWGLVAPDTGANPVVTTWNGASPGRQFGASSFTGVDQTTPTDGNALATTGSTANPKSTAKTGSLGDMLVDAIIDGNPITLSGPGTEIWNDGSGDGQQYLAADGTAQQTAWTATASNWANVVVLLKAVAAPTSGVEIADIRAGLVTNLQTISDSQQVSAYPKQAPTPPALIVVGFDTIERTTFGFGGFALPFQVQGLAGMPTAESAHIRLDKWLSPKGSLNVWAAIESDQTLGGLVDNVIVVRCDGSQILQIQSGVEMLGSTWHLQIEL